jgi:predicted DNA-binding protein (MmcQ/YjbR family)
MNADSIRAYCMSFADATENLQWGDDLCFKVKGKIFVILGLDSVPQRLCFKCTPESFAELCEREDIHPAPYVGRYKWVMLDRLDALRSDELRELIEQSYEMVRKKGKGGRREGKTSHPRKAGAKRSRRKS